MIIHDANKKYINTVKEFRDWLIKEYNENPDIGDREEILLSRIIHKANEILDISQEQKDNKIVTH